MKTTIKQKENQNHQTKNKTKPRSY